MRTIQHQKKINGPRISWHDTTEQLHQKFSGTAEGQRLLDEVLDPPPFSEKNGLFDISATLPSRARTLDNLTPLFSGHLKSKLGQPARLILDMFIRTLSQQDIGKTLTQKDICNSLTQTGGIPVMSEDPLTKKESFGTIPVQQSDIARPFQELVKKGVLKAHHKEGSATHYAVKSVHFERWYRVRFLEIRPSSPNAMTDILPPTPADGMQ